jgi:hypothetical protein
VIQLLDLPGGIYISSINEASTQRCSTAGNKFHMQE